MAQPGTTYVLEVNPRIPRRLARLEELATNLWYSWDRPTRALFARLHPQLWDAVGHSPKALLKRVDEKRLVEAAEDPVFLNNFNRVLSAYDTYHSEPVRRNGAEWLRATDLVAYFCAEFGFHESLPIYSGGLGILAGDHCKAASDMRLPFVGVGLLYRQGYFHADDRQPRARSTPSTTTRTSTTCRSHRSRASPEPSCASRSSCPGGTIACQGVARARRPCDALSARHRLRPRTRERDRDITHRLYGGDRTTRIEQEIVLGVGGVRALAALGLKPTVWHINEGHAAFLVLERMRGAHAGRASTSAPRSRRSPRTRYSPRTRRCRRATTISRPR